MADILEFNGITYLDIPPAKVLKAATEAKLDSVVAVGMAGGELYCAGSPASLAEVVYLLEKAKKMLMEIE